MLKRAEENKVEKIICIGTSHGDSLAAAEFALQHENIYWTYGVHPEALSTPPTGGILFERIEEVEDDPTLVAIGEVGLDYHYGQDNKEAQIWLFEEMLQIASDSDLPVVFHVREAFDDFFPVVRNFPGIKGVVHSFTDSKKVLKRILNETEFFIGVNGLATYSTLPTPPLERILLETDAPFLTPVPFRGIINEPAYVYNIAEWLSAKLGVELEIIERETTKNAEKLFKFRDPVLCES